MKKIPLTKGEFAIVDDCNYEWLMQWKWCACWDKHAKSFYAMRNDKIKNGKYHTTSMARDVLGLTYGDGKCSDHINHITLDNRMLSLRIVTNQQNSFNCKNTKGYCWHKLAKKYSAQIGINGKQKHLGLFYTTKEAHNAYLIAKKQYHKLDLQGINYGKK